MGFHTGAYATVWQVEQKSDRWTKIRVSISRKNKDTGEYEDEFGGFIDCIGSACAVKAARLKPRDRIKLGDVDVTTKYDKAKNITYTNYKMMGFEMADGNGGQQPQRQQAQQQSSPYEGENEPEDEYPF